MINKIKERMECKLTKQEQMKINYLRWRLKNKEWNREYQRNFYHANKNKDNSYTCECGTVLSHKNNKSKHSKTKKHINFINNN